MYINIFYILYLIYIYIYTYIYTNKMKVIDNPIILFFLQLIYIQQLLKGSGNTKNLKR